MPAFDLAVGLRVVGRGAHMSHAGDADELFEITGDELRPVVGDDAGVRAGELFAGTLQDGFHVDFLHFLADFPVDEETAVAVEDGTQEVKGASDVEVADVHMPLLVRPKRLHEAGPFLGDVRRRPGQEPRLLEDAVDTGRGLHATTSASSIRKVMRR